MKKRYMYAVACSLLWSAQAMAQTAYDAVRYAGDELNGTARFVGMGGAMGALGADISTIGTNPAGIGLFRGHDLSTSFGMNSTKTESDFGGSMVNDKRNKASFDQIGFVYSTKIGNRTTLRYLNFGFNYHKSRNFNKLFAAGGMLGGLSQTQQMANMMDLYSIKEIDNIYNYGAEGSGNLSNPYYNVDYPFLGIMGVRTELVGIGTFSNDKGEAYQRTIGWNGNSNGFRSREEGGINEYDFNVAFNVEDRMYFGITLGVNDVNYTRSTYYTEDIYDGGHSGFYELQNAYRTEGTGINLKLGAIFRPIEESPFRFGLAIHTPTWYSLTDTYSSNLYSKLTYQKEDGTMLTPLEFVEKTVSYVRISSAFSVRAGYNYSTSAFKDGAYKSLNANDMRTDTEYTNDLARNTVTVGLGYRSKWFYTDLAYKYDVYKSDFYAFSDEALQATKVTNERHQLLRTSSVIVYAGRSLLEVHCVCFI